MKEGVSREAKMNTKQFFETSKGDIVVFLGDTNEVFVRCFDSDGNSIPVLKNVFKTWKPRPDLIAFPIDEADSLPSSFDLLFDIKSKKCLFETIIKLRTKLSDIEETCRRENIIIPCNPVNNEAINRL